MKKRILMAALAAAVTTGGIYLYKRWKGRSRKTRTPLQKNHHLTKAFVRAKSYSAHH